MAAEVDIVNLALSYLGDNANVNSITPPDSSVQAGLASRFYPVARNMLLEQHTWGFATKRVALAALTNTTTEWDYCYQAPSDAVNLLAILPPDATDDYSEGLYSTSYAAQSPSGTYVPQPFSCEVDPNGVQVIYTDQVDAVLRYSALVTDPTTFSPTFTVCLGYLLASMLAGPLIKGDAGAKQSTTMLALYQKALTAARESDANQRRSNPIHNVKWIAGR